MNIAINCRYLSHSPHSGIGCHLVNYIEHIGAVMPDHQFYLYTEQRLKKPINLASNMHLVKLPFLRIGSNNALPNLHEQMMLYTQFKKHHIDLYHNVEWLPVFRSNVKTIITIHDLAYFLYPREAPGLFKKRLNSLYKAVLVKALKKANLILTVSQFIKRQIESNFPYTEGKVEYIYNSVNDAYLLSDSFDLEHLAPGINIPNKFLLYVGNDHSRKNLSILVESFAIFKRCFPNPYKLVLVGSISVDRLLETLDDPEVKKSISWFSPQVVSDETLLKKFYQRATATYLLSTYEGFGMTAIESMACGTPVVLSNTELFKEIDGDSALFVDPHNTREIAESMILITESAERREGLVLRSRETAARYNARKNAERLAEIYRKVKEL